MIYLQMEKLVVDLPSGVERNGAPGLEHLAIKVFVFYVWTGDEALWVKQLSCCKGVPGIPRRIQGCGRVHLKCCSLCACPDLSPEQG